VSIAERYADICKRLKEHDAARKLIEGELLALRHICQHEHTRTWNHHDYGGGSDHHWHCDDCGLHKIDGRVL